MAKEKSHEAPKHVYGGYYTFQNKLGTDILTGVASHSTSDYGAQNITLDGLPKGETSAAGDVTSSTTNRDNWSFWANGADGFTYSGGPYVCGFESEDSGQTVVIQGIVAGGDMSFNIAMPQSSGCSTSMTRKPTPAK